MALILFPFNAHTPQVVSAQRLLEAAPLVAEHIQTGDNTILLECVLNGLGIRAWNHRAAVEQFAFALSFHHPLDPSKVRQARESLTPEGYMPNCFDFVWDSFVAGSRAMIMTAVHEGRVPLAGEIAEVGRLAVLIARYSPLLRLDESGRDVLIDEISVLSTVFSLVLPDFLKDLEAATPQERRGKLFTQEVLERFPDMRDREQLIRILAEQIFAPFEVKR